MKVIQCYQDFFLFGSSFPCTRHFAVDKDGKGQPIDEIYLTSIPGVKGMGAIPVPEQVLIKCRKEDGFWCCVVRGKVRFRSPIYPATYGIRIDVRAGCSKG